MAGNITAMAAGADALSAFGALSTHMTPLWSGVVAAVVLVLSTVLLLRQRDDFARIPGPPAASWLLGHLPQVNTQRVHRFFQECTQLYGSQGLFKIRMAHLRCVVLSDPSLVQAICSRGSDLPKAHEVYDAVDELFSPVGRRSFFNTHSYDEWRMVRKATAPAFSPDNIRKSFPLLMKATNTLCDVLAARVAAGQDVVDVSEAAMRITLDVIGGTGYGYDFQASTYAPCELFEVIPPLLAEFTLRGTNPVRRLVHRLCPFLPAARKYNQHVKVCHKWWNILLKTVRATDIDAATAAGDTSLRVCLARLPVADDLLVPQLAVYLIAGFETTAHSCSWALYEIAANPDAQQKIVDELRTAGLLGPKVRPLEFADLAQLTWLNLVLKESMRLHPVASTGTIRKADRHITVGGYRLAPGTLLWAPFITLLTSRHNWERAEDFWPERWLQEQQVQAAGSKDAETQKRAAPTPQGHAANPPKSYLPFSDGPRDCIGQNLALMEARAMLATIVSRFELSVAPEMGGRQEVREKEVMKLTLQVAGGMRLKLKLRQS